MLELGVLGDRLVEQRIAAGDISADADQVARTLIARVELLKRRIAPGASA